MRPSSLLRIKDLVVSLLLISSLLLPFGCALQQKNLREPSFYLALQTENIETEISRLEEVIQSGTDSPSRAEAFLNLALLYSHHKNPLPDYMRALEMIDEYALLDPEGAKASYVQYLAALLQEIGGINILRDVLQNRLEIFRDENRRLRKENEILREKYETLTIETQKTKEIIEKLKNLDIRLERKRRNIE